MEGREAARLAQVPAEPWDASQAEAWWREHGTLARMPSRAPTGSAQTIQVEFGLGESRAAE